MDVQIPRRVDLRGVRLERLERIRHRLVDVVLDIDSFRSVPRVSHSVGHH